MMRQQVFVNNPSQHQPQQLMPAYITQQQQPDQLMMKQQQFMQPQSMLQGAPPMLPLGTTHNQSASTEDHSAEFLQNQINLQTSQKQQLMLPQSQQVNYGCTTHSPQNMITNIQVQPQSQQQVIMDKNATFAGSFNQQNPQQMLYLQQPQSMQQQPMQHFQGKLSPSMQPYNLQYPDTFMNDTQSPLTQEEDLPEQMDHFNYGAQQKQSKQQLECNILDQQPQFTSLQGGEAKKSMLSTIDKKVDTYIQNAIMRQLKKRKQVKQQSNVSSNKNQQYQLNSKSSPLVPKYNTGRNNHSLYNSASQNKHLNSNTYGNRQARSISPIITRGGINDGFYRNSASMAKPVSNQLRLSRAPWGSNTQHQNTRNAIINHISAASNVTAQQSNNFGTTRRQYVSVSPITYKRSHDPLKILSDMSTKQKQFKNRKNLNQSPTLQIQFKRVQDSQQRIKQAKSKVAQYMKQPSQSSEHLNKQQQQFVQENNENQMLNMQDSQNNNNDNMVLMQQQPNFQNQQQQNVRQMDLFLYPDLQQTQPQSQQQIQNQFNTLPQQLQSTKENNNNVLKPKQRRKLSSKENLNINTNQPQHNIMSQSLNGFSSLHSLDQQTQNVHDSLSSNCNAFLQSLPQQNQMGIQQDMYGNPTGNMVPTSNLLSIQSSMLGSAKHNMQQNLQNQSIGVISNAGNGMPHEIEQIKMMSQKIKKYINEVSMAQVNNLLYQRNGYLSSAGLKGLRCLCMTLQTFLKIQKYHLNDFKNIEIVKQYFKEQKVIKTMKDLRRIQLWTEDSSSVDYCTETLDMLRNSIFGRMFESTNNSLTGLHSQDTEIEQMEVMSPRVKNVELKPFFCVGYFIMMYIKRRERKQQAYQQEEIQRLELLKQKMQQQIDELQKQRAQTVNNNTQSQKRHSRQNSLSATRSACSSNMTFNAKSNTYYKPSNPRTKQVSGVSNQIVQSSRSALSNQNNITNNAQTSSSKAKRPSKSVVPPQTTTGMSKAIHRRFDLKVKTKTQRPTNITKKKMSSSITPGRDANNKSQQKFDVQNDQFQNQKLVVVDLQSKIQPNLMYQQNPLSSNGKQSMGDLDDIMQLPEPLNTIPQPMVQQAQTTQIQYTDPQDQEVQLSNQKSNSAMKQQRIAQRQARVQRSVERLYQPIKRTQSQILQQQQDEEKEQSKKADRKLHKRSSSGKRVKGSKSKKSLKKRKQSATSGDQDMVVNSDNKFTLGVNMQQPQFNVNESGQHHFQSSSIHTDILMTKSMQENNANQAMLPMTTTNSQIDIDNTKSNPNFAVNQTQQDHLTINGPTNSQSELTFMNNQQAATTHQALIQQKLQNHPLLQPSTSIEQTTSVLTGNTQTQQPQLNSQFNQSSHQQEMNVTEENNPQDLLQSNQEKSDLKSTEMKEQYDTCEKSKDHTFKQQQTLLNTLKDCKTRTIRVEDLIQKVNNKQQLKHDVTGQGEDNQSDFYVNEQEVEEDSEGKKEQQQMVAEDPYKNIEVPNKNQQQQTLQTSSSRSLSTLEKNQIQQSSNTNRSGQSQNSSNSLKQLLQLQQEHLQQVSHAITTNEYMKQFFYSSSKKRIGMIIDENHRVMQQALCQNSSNTSSSHQNNQTTPNQNNQAMFLQQNPLGQPNGPVINSNLKHQVTILSDTSENVLMPKGYQHHNTANNQHILDLLSNQEQADQDRNTNPKDIDGPSMNLINQQQLNSFDNISQNLRKQQQNLQENVQNENHNQGDESSEYDEEEEREIIQNLMKRREESADRCKGQKLEDRRSNLIDRLKDQILKEQNDSSNQEEQTISQDGVEDGLKLNVSPKNNQNEQNQYIATTPTIQNSLSKQPFSSACSKQTRRQQKLAKSQNKDLSKPNTNTHSKAVSTTSGTEIIEQMLSNNQ